MLPFPLGNSNNSILILRGRNYNLNFEDVGLIDQLIGKFVEYSKHLPCSTSAGISVLLKKNKRRLNGYHQANA